MKMKVVSIQEINNENQRVLNFIDDWQSKNDYDKSKLNQFNQKFKKDMNTFLENGKFTQETINFFKI